MKGDPLWDQLLPHTYRAYGWQPYKVTKVRGVFRVQTGRDIFALKPVNTAPERLAFLDRMNKHLLEHNYSHVLPWLKTKYGDAFYVGKQVSFYATPWFGTEWSPDAPISEETLIRSLAEMHQLTENIDMNKNEHQAPTFEQTVKRWGEQMEQVKSYAQVAGKREYTSPFDVTFLAYVDELSQAASFALNGLQRMSEIDAQKLFRRVLCLQRVHRHNLVIHESNWKWIDLQHAGFDVPMRDIAAFMHRFPPQNEDTLETLKVWLNAYEQSFPLNRKEKQLLCLFLAYPEPVMRWLNRYYKRKRSRDEMHYVEGLESALHYFKVLKQFVKRAWPKEPKK